MIKNILELLKLSDYLNESENIAIAKGKYKLAESFKEEYRQRIRGAKEHLRKVRDGR